MKAAGSFVLREKSEKHSTNAFEYCVLKHRRYDMVEYNPNGLAVGGRDGSMGYGQNNKFIRWPNQPHAGKCTNGSKGRSGPPCDFERTGNYEKAGDGLPGQVGDLKLRSKDVWFYPRCKVDRNLPEDNPIMMCVKGQRKYSVENKCGDLEYFYTNTQNWKGNQCGNGNFDSEVMNETCAYRWGDPIQMFTRGESEDEAGWFEWPFNVEKGESTMQST